jgi:PTH1 family peptidyl-tRNA hydrolase
MYIVCGLGNPGLKYKKTRHNMGFMTIDCLSERLGIKVNKLKFKAKVGDGMISGHKVVFVKPQTFMNLSGHSLREVMDFYKVEPDHLIVIYDDMDLETGRIRVRAKGSAGTHNGMRSVVKELGYSDFPRVRIGIGSPEGRGAIGHVIGKIEKSDKETLDDAITRAADSVLSIIEEGVTRAMNKYNGNN